MPSLRAVAITAVLAVPGFAAPVLAQQSPCGPTTTVRPGDTYFAIAQRCDVSVRLLERANPGVDPYSLQIGQTLQLTAEAPPQPSEPAPEEPPRAEADDPSAGIAQALGTTIGTLLRDDPDLEAGARVLGQLLTPEHPDQEQPETRVSGILTGEGIECQAMRGHDGELYTLVGDLEGHDDGDVVRVRGHVQEVSFCQQGTTIQVAEIE